MSKGVNCENCREPYLNGGDVCEKCTGSELPNINMINVLSKRIQRWEDYRLEMENFEHQMAKTAKSFLELGAYSSAAECAIKADGMKFILGRMPALK